MLFEAEGNVTDAKKQYDQTLKSKQLELSRHLKEISQKNDQVRSILSCVCINLSDDEAK